MNLVFNFSEQDFISLCSQNIQRLNTTIFQDIYASLVYFLNTETIDSAFNI